MLEFDSTKDITIFNTIYWVGTGGTYTSSSYYPECFPGNIFRAIYLLEHSSKLGYSPNGASSMVEEHHSLIETYVKPLYDYAMMKLIEYLKSKADSFEPNSSSGMYLYHDGPL